MWDGIPQAVAIAGRTATTHCSRLDLDILGDQIYWKGFLNRDWSLNLTAWIDVPHILQPVTLIYSSFEVNNHFWGFLKYKIRLALQGYGFRELKQIKSVKQQLCHIPYLGFQKDALQNEGCPWLLG